MRAHSQNARLHAYYAVGSACDTARTGCGDAGKWVPAQVGPNRVGDNIMPVEPVALEDIQAARERILRHVLRTPLLRLNVDDATSEIFLKLENLQPIGSFKLRGASNVMLQAAPADLEPGVWTASAGNMALT